MDKQRISVLGAGLMGHGLAYLFARHGHAVKVFDSSADALATLEPRIRRLEKLAGADEFPYPLVTTHNDLSEAVGDADIVIEAALENLAVKRDLFARLERHAQVHAVLATNSSTIPISQISAGLVSRERMIGAHFWNPPHRVRLVEVVQPTPGHEAAATRMRGVLHDMGHHPVLIRQDIPGLIGNRLQHALKREAIALVAAGVCDAETVDDVVKLGFGARLAVLGPLEQSDLVGLALTKSIHDLLMPLLDATPNTHPYLEALVANGNLGMANGQGFRKWTPEAAQAVRERLDRFLQSLSG